MSDTPEFIRLPMPGGTYEIYRTSDIDFVEDIRDVIAASNKGDDVGLLRDELLEQVAAGIQSHVCFIKEDYYSATTASVDEIWNMLGGWEFYRRAKQD